MSDPQAQETELNDTVLCYQALGLSIDDSPAHIEHTVNRLTEEYKANLASTDPAVRESARKNLALVKEMHDKIKGSVTYNSKLREQQSRGTQHSADNVNRAVKSTDPHLKKASFVACPACNTIIPAGHKSCPKCKAPVLSKSEQLMKKYLTPANIAILCLIIILAGVGGFVLLFPKEFDALLDLVRNLSK